MAELPLHFIPIHAGLGDFEAGEALTLPSSFSTDGSKNIWIDKVGRTSSILGYTRRNAAAVTSNTGAAALRLRHLFHHVAQSAVHAVTRTELAIFTDDLTYWELRASTDLGQTWTFIYDFGVGMAGQIPSFAQSGSVLLLATGAGKVQRVSPSALTTTDAGAAQAAAPSVTDAGVGLLNGTKQWKIIGIAADGTRLVGSLATPRQTFASRKVTLAWAAVAGAFSYEIYSTPGTGQLYFAEGAVDAATLSWTSNIADIDLVQNRLLQEHGDPPPSLATYLFMHKQRMFYVLASRRVYFSDAGLPESVYQNTNYIDLTDAESWSDEAVGGTGGYKGMAIIWLERSVWTLSGALTVSGSVIDIVRHRTSAGAGAVHGRAVARMPAGATYMNEQGQKQATSEVTLAYLTPLGDLRLFDGESDVIISWAKASLFSRLSYDARRKAFCVMDTPRTEVTWIFPHDGATECSTAVTWNWARGTMVERPAWLFAHAIEVDAPGDSSVLLAGEAQPTVGGYCYQLWDGLFLGDGATAVNAAVMFKTLYGSSGKSYQSEDEAELMSLVKRWRWVDLLVKCTAGPVTFTVEIWPEEADPTDQPYASRTVTTPTELVFSSDGQPVLSADGSQLAASVLIPILRVKLRQVDATHERYLHSRGLRFRLSSTTTKAAWSLVGANVAYQLLTGLERTYRRPFKFHT